MKKIISAIIFVAMIFSSSISFAAFFDVAGSSVESWAGEAIYELERNGIINGYDDSTFRPYGNVTRAEFAKMLCLAFDCESGEKTYPDTVGHWAESYITKTSDCVFTQGDVYEPDEDAARAEVAYALACVSKIEPELSGYDSSDHEWGEDEEELKNAWLRASYSSDVLKRFSDADSVDDAMKYYVAIAVDYGFVNGYEDSSLRGDAPVTRAEAAVLIHRAMNYENEAPGQSEDVKPEDATGSGSAENQPKPDEDSKGPSDEFYDTLLEKGHIYTLYPQKDFLLVSSATMIYDENGDEDYKLKYYVAGTGDEFESVVDSDTVVAGIRNELSQIRSGDVLILDTAFWGEIDCLYVIGAAKHNGDFAYSCPKSDDWGEYPSNAEYEVIGGKLLSAKLNSKSYALEIQNENGIQNVNATAKANVDIYDAGSRRNNWENDTLSALVESEDTFVLVRLTDGRVTDVVAFKY